MPSAPSYEFQLLALLAFILPGVVHEAVRARFSGPSPQQRDATARVLGALTISTLLALVYAATFGPWVQGALSAVRGSAVTQVQWMEVAGAGLLLLFVIPAGTGWARHALAVRKIPDAVAQYDPTPSAWDFAFKRAGTEGFIRILLKDGSFVGGWFGSESFATGYPDPHEIYIEDAYDIDVDGVLGSPRGQGVWVSGEQVATVEFVPNSMEEVTDVSERQSSDLHEQLPGWRLRLVRATIGWLQRIAARL